MVGVPRTSRMRVKWWCVHGWGAKDLEDEGQLVVSPWLGCRGHRG